MPLPAHALAAGLSDTEAAFVEESVHALSGADVRLVDTLAEAADLLNSGAFDALVVGAGIDAERALSVLGTASRPETLIGLGGQWRGADVWSGYVQVDLRRAAPDELGRALRQAQWNASEARSAVHREATRSGGGPRLRLLEAAVVHAGDSVVITDAELDDPGPRIVYANPAFERLTGYSLDEVRGLSPRILQGPLTDRVLIRKLRDDLATGRSFEGSTYNYRKDGTAYIVRWRVEPIREAGRITHWVSIQRDVTELETSLARLSRVRETLSLTLAVAEVGTWQQKRGEPHVSASDSLNNLFGLPLGRSHEAQAYFARIHPDDLELFVGAHERAMTTGVPFASEFRLHSPEFGLREIMARSIFHQGGGESGARLIVTMRDVTEARHAERERNRVLQRNTDILESITEAFFSISTSGKLRYINTAAEKLLGSSGRSYLGRNADALLSRLGADRLVQAISEANASRTNQQIADYAWRGRILDVNLFPYETGVSVYLHDVTEQHAASQLALRTQERFEQAVRGTSDGIYYWDVQSDETYLSPRFYEMLGYEPDEFAPTFEALSERTHPDDLPEVNLQLERHLTGQTPQLLAEYRLRRADGSYVWVLSRGLAQFDEKGVPTQLAGAVVDISQRRDNERALSQANAEMEQANETLESRVDERTSQLDAANKALESRNRELADFAFVASHDLQEPLRKIRAFGGLLADEYGSRLDSDATYYIDRMRDAASRMNELISDLLDYSRVTSQGRPFVPVDLRKTFERVAGDLSIRIEETSGTLALDAPDDLKPLIADPTQLYQLLLNLAGNALKFNQPGVPPRVTVRVRFDEVEHPACVIIEVIDNGVGFRQQFADRIFAPFQRLHGRDAYEGTGIGLAICRRIVERHGGEISATSEPGEGATFRVVLPMNPNAIVVGRAEAGVVPFAGE